jgi:hypothetical protein
MVNARYLVEIRKQNTLEEAEEPHPEPKERTMMVSKLTEKTGPTELVSSV